MIYIDSLLRYFFFYIQTPLTEQDIINQLPHKDMTLSIMVVTKILSDRGTNALGDFEIQYQYEPKAVQAVERYGYCVIGVKIYFFLIIFIL